MSLLPARAPQTRALLAWLDAQLQFPIGRGKAPTDVPTGWQGPPGISAFAPYAVVHSIPGGEIDGDLHQPHSDGDLPWQIDAVGGTQDQAETVADLVDEIVLGVLPPLVIAGRTVMAITVDVPHGGARQDPDQPSIWRSTGRYRIATTQTT